MASAYPIVNPEFLDHDPDQHSDDDSKCLTDFDQWYLKVSLKKLLNVHTSNQERWNIIHWMTSYPFVSDRWADPELRNILTRATNRLKLSGDIEPADIDPHAVIEREVSSLGLTAVCFSVTRRFEVVPYLTSFEAVCLRLDLDPEDLIAHVEYMMRQRGIQYAIDNRLSLVKPKIEPVPKTLGLFDFDDSDPRVAIVPCSIKQIRDQFETEAKEAAKERAKKGKSLEDRLDDACNFIETFGPSDTAQDQLFSDIDILYSDLGLDEVAA